MKHKYNATRHSIKILVPCFLIAFSFLCITSCRKNEDNTPPVSTMQSMVDGKLLVCDSLVTTDDDGNGTVFTYIGIQKDSSTIVLYCPTLFGPGTFPIGYVYNGYLCKAFYIRNGIPYFTYSAVEGSIELTNASSNHVTGTFSFKCEGPGTQFPDEVQVTQGVFDIHI